MLFVCIYKALVLFLEEGNFLLIYICNFHVLSHFLLIYICKLHWNLGLNAAEVAITAVSEGGNTVVDEYNWIVDENVRERYHTMVVDVFHIMR